MMDPAAKVSLPRARLLSGRGFCLHKMQHQTRRFRGREVALEKIKCLEYMVTASAYSRSRFDSGKAAMFRSLVL